VTIRLGLAYTTLHALMLSRAVCYAEARRNSTTATWRQQ